MSPHPDFTLLQYRKIETRALARQESFDDVSAAELDAELVTGHPRLGHHHDGEPTPNLSPMFSSASKNPAVVKFSPNIPQGSFI
jgi:hypothetical protein